MTYKIELEYDELTIIHGALKTAICQNGEVAKALMDDHFAVPAAMTALGVLNENNSDITNLQRKILRLTEGEAAPEGNKDIDWKRTGK